MKGLVQDLIRDPLHGLDPLAQRQPCSRVRRDRGRNVTIVTIAFGGAASGSHFHQLLQGDQVPVLILYGKLLEVFRFVPLEARSFCYDVVLFPFPKEIADPLAAVHELKGLGHVPDADPHLSGLLPVNLKLELRFGELQVPVHGLEGFVLLSPLHELGENLFELIDRGSLEDELNGKTAQTAVTGLDGLFLGHISACEVLLGELLAELIGQLHLTFFPLIRGNEPDAQETGIDVDAGTEARRGHGQKRAFFREGVRDFEQLLHVAVHPFIGDPFRSSGEDPQSALVLQGGHFGRKGAADPDDGPDGQDHNGKSEPADVQESVQRTPIPIDHPLQAVLDPSGDPRASWLKLEDPRAHHGRDR